MELDETRWFGIFNFQQYHLSLDKVIIKFQLAFVYRQFVVIKETQQAGREDADQYRRHQGATAGNAALSMQNMPHLLPLVKAIDTESMYLVLGAQFHLQINDPLGSLDEAQTAKVERYLWLLHSVSDDSLAREKDRFCVPSLMLNPSPIFNGSLRLFFFCYYWTP
ncbi:hypothetical protein N7519_009088 [Penicillium mononematosum]|uniref:uncharacterized protein n=1 Tax=Penicillium mononematosum TaxID=268346 RepID=UPI0025488415|nr:uncharacterized protein N7519_009088 [Penicillium mononematosum]KAJ6178627.1 hypothetical protein N7519_009088 [Penicillium mononematosum]